MSLYDELNRRGVVRAAALYVAVAWGGTEILVFLFDALWGEAIANPARKYLAILFVAGFPAAMYLSWTRDLGLRARRIAGAGGLAIFVIALLLWLAPSDPGGSKPPAPGPGQIRSLAVLPLTNFSDDPEQDFFAAGMTEALIAELSQLGAIKVISRTSVMRYQDSTQPLPEIAAELGVDAIVEGSVLRSHNSVRITAQLIEAATDHHLWAGSVEGELEDVLGLQKEAAVSIVLGIGASVGNPDALARKARRVNPQAYDAYLQARLKSPDGRGDPQAAIELARRAIELDETFAPAYALLSNIYGYLALGTAMPHGDAYLKASHFAHRALDLDPWDPHAHFALARVHFQFEWDWPAAEAEFARGLDLDPNNAFGLGLYGGYRVLIHLDCEGGLARLRSARDLDPFAVRTHFNLGVYSFHCGRRAASIESMTRVTEIAPAFLWPRMIIAWSLALDGAMEPAMEICDSLGEDMAPAFEGRFAGACAWIYAQGGRQVAAEELLQQVENPPDGSRVDPFTMSWIRAAFGDRDVAIEYLAQAFEERSSELIFLRTAPLLDALRDDPRFQAITAQMNYPQ
jgi:TolB-like protein/tetratricopeptide (TPR) repeat protein